MRLPFVSYPRNTTSLLLLLVDGTWKDQTPLRKVRVHVLENTLIGTGLCSGQMLHVSSLKIKATVCRSSARPDVLWHVSSSGLIQSQLSLIQSNFNVTKCDEVFLCHKVTNWFCSVLRFCDNVTINMLYDITHLKILWTYDITNNETPWKGCTTTTTLSLDCFSLYILNRAQTPAIYIYICYFN